jgi:hypothetical protein
VKPKLRVVSIKQLVLDEKNANKGTKRVRELLGDSLAILRGVSASEIRADHAANQALINATLSSMGSVVKS